MCFLYYIDNYTYLYPKNIWYLTYVVKNRCLKFHSSEKSRGRGEISPKLKIKRISPDWSGFLGWFFRNWISFGIVISHRKKVSEHPCQDFLRCFLCFRFYFNVLDCIFTRFLPIYRQKTVKTTEWNPVEFITDLLQSLFKTTTVLQML